ncbi:sensor histidine kinase [Paenibacillus sp. P22]|uniref:sensor histidine kinase n=1 Tax=Paenibacillus sp. P22 TaxID=483908 RepID=UPI000432BA85|nr:histidine kinase [Paenibacillus sp. P22]CDN42786.1 Sensor histidine kinase YvfT [Paenibacillus sp. P22]
MAPKGRRPRSGPPIYFPLVWLVYLTFPVASILQLPAGEQAASFGLLGAFSAVYVYSFLKPRHRLAGILLQQAIIVYFSTRLSINFLYMAFFPSPIIGFLKSGRQAAAGLSGMALLFAATAWLQRDEIQGGDLLQLVPALIIMLVMPLGIRIGMRSRELRSRLTMAEEEIARLSKNEERQRISRDLHDTLGHTLSLITLKGELAERLVRGDPARAEQEARDIQAASRAALKQVRELVSGMNGATLRDELLHARQILAAAGIALNAGSMPPEGTVPALADNILGMCLREAVTNAVKHSKASELEMERIRRIFRLIQWI